MAMKRRERILASVTAALALLLGSYYALSGLGPAGARQRDRDRLKDEVEKKQWAVRRGETAKAQLIEWQKRSLPDKHEIARSLYQSWLGQLAEQVGLKNTKLESSEGRLHQKAYYLLPFTVRGQGRMEDLVRFLYQFYKAGHLQQIRHLSIKPAEGTGKGEGPAKALDLVISIEAVSLPTAANTDKLSTEPGPRLALAGLDDYRKVIVDRDLFSPFHPGPAKVAEAGPSTFDPCQYACFTAVLNVDGRPQTWLRSMTTDQLFKLAVGDQFTVGSMHGRVTRIGAQDVEVEVEGARRVLALGTHLHETPPAR